MKDETLDCQNSFCVWPGRRYQTICYFLFEPCKLREKCTRKEDGQLCSQGKTEIKDNLGVAKNETIFASGFKKDNYVDLGGKTECFMAAFIYTPLLSQLWWKQKSRVLMQLSRGIRGSPLQDLWEHTFQIKHHILCLRLKEEKAIRNL